MTAEIAIVNRTAVTLAADSAMTVTIGTARKVYTSTDKIFELSNQDPIGLMIYNNLEFMGAPLDVLIREFRNSTSCVLFPHLQDAPVAFFSYLEDHWSPSKEIQDKHAKQIVAPVFSSVRKRFHETIFGIIGQNKKRKNVGDLAHYLFLENINREISKYKNRGHAPCFDSFSLRDMLDYYREILVQLAENIFASEPLDEEYVDLLCELGALVLRSDNFSPMLTGLVFAGFGADEKFPSLVAYHLDGIIAGKLKYRETDQEKTSQDAIHAKILPFAQREVVDRFLVGIDPQLEKGIENYIASIFAKTKENIASDLKGLKKSTKEKILENLDASLGISLREFADQWLAPTKERYQKETEDMVLFMAKQELAHLAEALVNITSLKRKFSAGEETVAGPIDVAVISRSDGFVWVKRKHYFPRDLNPRYYARKFGNNEMRGGDEDATP